MSCLELSKQQVSSVVSTDIITVFIGMLKSSVLFSILWKNTSISISHNSYSTSQSGIEYVLLGLISNLFPPLGFPLNDQLFRLIIRRYSDEKGNMDFDNFIGCLVRLDAMCRTLTEYLAVFIVSSQAQYIFRFSMTCLANVSLFTGAFKTLDNDNNGTIKVNIQEVLYGNYN